MADTISTRASLLAITSKTTAGALVTPTKASDFMAIQPDISFAPNFETVENAEIKNDIMAAQVAISGQVPTVGFSHYLKGSGTEGEAPAFGRILQSSFGGMREVTAVTLASGSTVSELKAASSSDASKFSKGDAILIKDTTNGFSVRPVKGVSGTDIELGFDLDTAPASGIMVGKTTTYFPTSSDQPVVDCFLYLGGGRSGLETMKDGVTSSIAISANAKENINATFSLEGTEYTFNNTSLQNASGNWVPTVSPAFEDTAPVISRGQTLFLGVDSSKNVCLDAPSLSFNVGTPPATLTSVCEPSGNFSKLVTSRTATMSVSSFVEEKDARFFETFNNNDTISFFFGAGSKDGTNFKPGETFSIYGSEATITNFSLSQVSDVWAVDLELACYSPGDGTGSIFIGFQ